MAIYLKYFQSVAEYEQYAESENYVEPHVSLIQEDESVQFNKAYVPKHPYLAFKITSGGTIVWKATDASIAKEISYSKNSGDTWTTVTATTAGAIIEAASGDVIMFKGINDTYGNSTNYNTFSGSTAKFELEGDIMSLLYVEDFEERDNLVSAYTFYRLFKECTGLTLANKLVLPASSLTENCYTGMFEDCTSLTTAPVLPATELATGCYGFMFNNCSSLTTAPALPATTLGEGCYNSMFKGCSNIVSAPALPATALTTQCYYQMFSGCTSLTSAPVLPAKNLTSVCYAYMFDGCSNLNYIKCYATDIYNGSTDYWVRNVSDTGIFEKPATMTGWTVGVNGIPEGWVSTDFNPYQEQYLTFVFSTTGSISTCFDEIYLSNDDGETWTNEEINISTPGTKILVKGDKKSFFETCMNAFICHGEYSVEGNIMSIYDSTGFTSRTAFDSSGDDISYIFYYCDGLTSAENLVLPVTALTPNCYNCMFNNCTSLTTAPTLPATTLATSCYYAMFYGCTSLTTAPTLPATTLANYCYYGMFSNCTSLTTAPSILPATTLAQSCYGSMFENCTGLTTAPTLPATTLAESCYDSMFNGCSGLTTAPSSIGNSATTMPASACSQMFQGCTSLTTAPELPATTLATSCYEYMFNGCSSLTTAPELPATTLATGCYNNMFARCSSLNYIKCLATNISASNCTRNWTYGVSGSGTFVKDKNMGDWTTGVNGIPVNWEVENNADYASEYLTFVFSTTGSIYPNFDELYLSNDDGQTWISGETIDILTPGTKILAKGDRKTFYEACTNAFSCEGEYSVEGNIMSIYDSTGFTSRTTFDSNDDDLAWLFYNCDGLTSAENLVLPATALTEHCYSHMFEGCTGLTTAPALPATTLADMCYYCIFGYCTSLTTAPALPATTLSERCYDSMFNNCNSLTTAPALPATTLATGCYECMFENCTGLTTAPALPATTLAESCYQSMFSNCTSLTTASELPATTLADYCYGFMFNLCTSLTTAPELPATTLATGCYECMFDYCTSLNYIKCLATDISASNCTRNWVRNVSGSGTFVKDINMTGWTTGNNGIPTNWTIENYDKRKEQYITFDIVQDGNIVWKTTSAGNAKTISYSKDNGVTWTPITATTTGTTIGVTSGESIMFKGTNTTYASDSVTYNTFSGTTARFTVSNNIMSLVYGDNYSDASALTGTYAFTKLFEGCTGLTSASNLCLPAMVLTEGCYLGMFSHCITLTISPSLPASALTNSCYSKMFDYCTSLTTAPALPATTLANYCYEDMFNHCTSLTTAPALPATSLTQYCYYQMFQDCNGLTVAPALPATTLGYNCYGNMFKGCTSLTSAPALPATTLDISCYFMMFSGCTSLTTAPSILPASALTTNCYYGMFIGCTSLTTAPELIAPTLGNGSYQFMFAYCSSLNYVKCLATNISATDCTSAWLYDVSGSGTFVKDKTATGWTEGSTNGIPSGWMLDVYDTYIEQYMTCEMLGNGTFSVVVARYSTSLTRPSTNISYSVNNGTWVDETLNSTNNYAITFNVSTGDKIRFKSTGTTYCNTSSNKSWHVIFGYNNTEDLGNNFNRTDLENYVTTINFDVYGNIMSLLYGDNFSGQTSLGNNNFTFCSIFKAASVVSAENLVFPATTLKPSCYRGLFSKSLTLQISPTLPATTLVDSCYNYMFENCATLIKVTCLAENPGSNTGLSGFMTGCTASASNIFYKSSNTTTTGSGTNKWPSGASGIMTSWTVEDAVTYPRLIS